MTTRLCARSSWYEYAWFETTRAMLGYARAGPANAYAWLDVATFRLSNTNVYFQVGVPMCSCPTNCTSDQGQQFLSLVITRGTISSQSLASTRTLEISKALNTDRRLFISLSYFCFCTSISASALQHFLFAMNFLKQATPEHVRNWSHLTPQCP